MCGGELRLDSSDIRFIERLCWEVPICILWGLFQTSLVVEELDKIKSVFVLVH